MRFCVIGHDAGALYGASRGGAEKQLALLARHLAKRGHEVTLVVTGNSGREDFVDGVQVQPGWQADRGVRGIRLITYRLPNVKRLLRNLAAEAYYIMGISFYTLPVAGVARGLHATMLFGMANDLDFDASSGKSFFAVGSPLLSSMVGPVLHAYFRRRVLPQVDWVIVQNEKQAAACQEFGLPSQCIPAMIEPPPEELLALPEEVDVIWIGNVINDTRRSKGVKEFVELVRLLPDVRFEMIGQLTARGIQPEMDELKGKPNVHISGPLSYGDTLARIARSRLVINTSPVEGFSNVMLEAWSLGKPVVSLCVDPNYLLQRAGLGICAGGDLHGLTDAIMDLLGSEWERRIIGERSRSYVSAMHDPNAVCAQFEELVYHHRADTR